MQIPTTHIACLVDPLNMELEHASLGVVNAEHSGFDLNDLYCTQVVLSYNESKMIHTVPYNNHRTIYNE